MPTFHLQIEASVAVVGGANPLLEVMLNGAAVSSASITAQTGVGSDILVFTIDDEIDPLNPVSLAFRFNGTSGDITDVVTIHNVRINGQLLGAGDLTATIISQGQSATVTSPAAHDHLFGRVEPTPLPDFGPPTVTAPGGGGDVSGGTGADVIEGSTNPDRILGLDDDDAINGGDGDDSLFGQLGNDIILGGAGNDKIFGNEGDDILYGQDDNDVLSGGTGNDVLNGGAGDDSLNGEDGDDILFGEGGNDTLTGGNGINWMYGDDGDDRLIGGNAADHMFGGIGTDQINGGLGDDELMGDDGADFVNGGNGNDTVNGGAGNDQVMGGAGLDIVDGGANDDTILIANGQYVAGESLTGGSGSDTILLTNATTVDFSIGTLATVELLTGSALNDNVTMTVSQFAGFATAIDMMAGTDVMTVTVSGTVNVSAMSTPTVSGVETGNLTGSANADAITITGAQLDAIISGTGTVNMGGNTDTITLTSTSADLNSLSNAGITGLEIISVSGSPVITINLSAQTEAFTINGGGGVDTITGGSGADTITGGAGNDLITGGAGADNIDGGANDDTIYLANGDFASGESITGGGGNDSIVLTNATTVDFSAGTLATVETLTGSASDDTVTLSVQQWVGLSTINMAANANDRINVRVSGTVDISASGTPTVSNAEHGYLIGSTGADSFTLTGAQLNAILNGSGTVDMDAGADTLNLTSTSSELNTLGGTDASVSGLETITVSLAAANVTVNMGGQTEAFTMTGNTGIDTFTGGSGDDTLTGNSGNDVLSGGGGADTINGGDNDDTITGGTGADIIDGGNNNDTINLANNDFAAGESITGNAGTDNITLTNATTVDFTTGTIATVENLNGSGNADTVTVSAAQYAVFTSGINMNGGVDTFNVNVSGSVTISTTPAITNTENVNITGTGSDDTLTIAGGSLDTLLAGTTSNTINLGAGTNDTITLTTASSADLSTLGSGADGNIVGVEFITVGTAAINVTVNMSGQSEAFTMTGNTGIDTFTGGSGADTLTGNAGNDILTGGAGADIMDGGANDDTFNLANGDWTAGESITGGANNDTISLTNATTVDFTTGTISTVETLNGANATNDNVTLSSSQLVALSTINLGTGGTDVLTMNVSGAVDVSAATTAISNVETGNITGTGSDDSLTITGAFLDAILTGTGTINMGGGTGDALNINATSADLNTLGLTDGLVQGLETITVTLAGANVTVNMSGQTEAFTLTGNTGIDTFTGGSAGDTFTGGTGADVLSGGGGDDIFNLANGDFTGAESITGGTNGGTGDTIVLTNATTVDFTTGTLATIENLTGSASDDNVTVVITQYAGMFSAINLAGGGSDRLNVLVNGAANITAVTAATVTNTENGYLIGSANADTLTITGAQLDDIIGGTGTIAMGGNTDIINLTSTSSDLNTLGSTDASITGLETVTVSLAGANVTVNLSGQSEAFTLTGNTGIDTFTGGSAADIITGGTGADVLSGGGGDDTFNLANGDWSAGESITGGADSGAGNRDSIVLTNATTIDFTTGTIATVETLGVTGNNNDTVTLGALQWVNFTTINLGGGTDRINVQFSGGATDISAITSPTVSNVESSYIIGTGGDDNVTLTGTQFNNMIIGVGTADLGAGTNDTITLTSTSTTLNALANASLVNVEAIAVSGSPTITINLTNQTEGFLITGGGGADTITGGSGNDIIEGGAGNDTLNGNGGTDTLTYQNAASAVTISLAVGGGQVTGGAGTDTVSNFENLTGSDFNDNLTGSGAVNTVLGGLGNDTIAAGDGADIVDGGDGDDTINIANGDFDAGESIDGGNNTGTGDVIVLTNATTVDFTTGTLADVERLTGSANGDTVTVSAAQWAMFATSINMQGGTDSLTVIATGNITALSTPASVTNLENATLSGTASDDTVTMTGAQLNAILSGTTSNTVNFGAGTADTLNLTTGSTALNGLNDASITNLEIISASAAGAGVTISLANQTEAFTLTGSGFDDTLTGGSAADTINGGAGNDTIEGRGGNDIMDGGAGTGDTASYANAASRVVVNLATAGAQNTVGAGTDTLTGFENVTGSAFNDILTGDTGANTIDGGGGNDVVEGGAGNDTLIGGSGSDTVRYTNAGSAVTVNLATLTAQNTVGAGTDTLSGFENLTGSNYNDTLTGDTVANIISGGVGSDTINGGDGADTLYAATTPVILVNTTFNASTESFAYNDDVFGGSDTNGYVSGSRNTGDGVNGNGALEVFFNGTNNTAWGTMSGGHSLAFNATEDVEDATLSFQFRVIREGTYETNEDSYVYVTIDGVYYGLSGNSYIRRFESDGNDPQYDSGWIHVDIDLGTVAAGSHTIVVGGMVEGKNAGDEDTTIRFDNIVIASNPDDDDTASNVLNGGNDGDTLYGSAGTDTLNGDAGNDTIYSQSTANINSAAVLAAYAGVQYNATTGSFYLYVNSNVTWSVAQSAAAAYTIFGVAGHLAQPNDATENAYIDSLTGNAIWIGGSDGMVDGEWRWVGGPDDGVQFWQGLSGGSAVGGAYTNWNAGEPNNYNGYESRLEMYDGGAWNDELEGNTARYVIEWEADQILVSGNPTTLNGGDGVDNLYGSGGEDIFAFDNINNIDVIHNFDRTDGDTIDVEDVLTGYGAGDNIAEFVIISDGLNADLYDAIIRNYDPLLYYRMSEGAGGTMTDAMGILNGTYDNTPTYSNAAFNANLTDNTSIDFNGTDERARVADNAIFDMTGGTFMAWFKSETNVGDHMVFSKDGTGSATGQFYMGADMDNGNLIGRLQIGGNTYTINVDPIAMGASNDIDQNTWYHLAFTFGTGGATVYLNGVAVYNQAAFTSIGSDYNFVIGAENSGGSTTYAQYWNGDIDEVAVFNYKMTQNAVASIYAVGVALTDANSLTDGVFVSPTGAIGGFTQVADFNGTPNTLNPIDMLAGGTLIA